MKSRILIVEDELDSLKTIEEIFRINGYVTATAQNGLEALNIIQAKEPDIIISDISMPIMDGMRLLDEVNRRYPDISVIMLTGHESPDWITEAMKKGAKDFLLKPFRMNEILLKVDAIIQLRSVILKNQQLNRQLAGAVVFDEIVGQDSKMIALYQDIKKIAPSEATTLIFGESGTGKELMANAIHFNSARSKKPFVKLNCVVLPENLLESELFGQEKDASDRISQQKIGYIERADGGTLFLDEIGDISPIMQLKLLRFLQEQEFQRVGSSETIRVDVRIIAATNRNLEKAVEAGRFRADLYYRLNVIDLEVPPLRARADDIPLLVSHFIKKFNETSPKKIKAIDDETMLKLQTYHWPGNIRELENSIQRAVIFSSSEILTVEDFPKRIINYAPSLSDMSNGEDYLQRQMENHEKQIILKVLTANHYNKTLTARELGINRTTLMSKLKKYQL